MNQWQQVLVVDDHAQARAWLVAAVRQAFPSALIAEAASVRTGLAALRAQCPDLLLMDLGLPDGSGLELLKALKAASSRAEAVVFTVFDDDEHVFAALRLGAAGYVLKQQSREQLAELLQDMLGGQPPLSPAVARRVMAYFSQPKAQAAAAEPEAGTLTPREREVLQLIGKGYAVPETARALGISRNTAVGYVKDIYRKLHVSGRAEAALAASRMGLV